MPPESLVLPDPVTVPVNVPPTRYSREDNAVVNGATGNSVSLVAATVNTHPSGVVTTPGGEDATTPSSGGGGPGSAAGTTAGSGSAGGSASATGAAPIEVSMQAEASRATRFNMAKPFTK
ncbi:hypothetical protein MMAD_50910 [Mycolicibacterium madagascariense]|uniref:Uncharacterized protein n=1 Tax=Mycolicibacterium madagascariense TaxID=212765 RepID=A0A7I7XNL8_9MYCO|nr:hypothetical protein MMAD_50910 [Mycolicibacterium madagascariense]